MLGDFCASAKIASSFISIHLVLRFVMRKADAEKLKMYYYVGRVGSYSNLHETKRDNNGENIGLVEMDLRLTKPLSTELYQHLTGNV
ncbi:hypothetical protein BAAM0483_09155 [Bifidobacterium animalis subsp. animalis MCC 0483]|uniref:DUF3427 domain-containing protein n=1 Tax=Bifidobacterium animalis subsp. animalis MCC 0483 TaxID=1365955 RepID=A0AB34T561_9BIFI|nr:DUF3427 domain-containing protein [Bifidobacterium animalis]KOA47830.1 hypothetical protein BAAM0483_09155 [Bifidobacterium animalis subsp. animalis MCC 0483]